MRFRLALMLLNGSNGIKVSENSISAEAPLHANANEYNHDSKVALSQLRVNEVL
jgi:hypothetical protein